MVEIRIEGPGKNALGTARMQELLDAVAAADGAPLLFTGAGDAFSAGLDLKEVYQADMAKMQVFLERLTSLLVQVFHHPAPTVAAVNGHAIAGGALLALVCDHRIMTTNPKARIGLNEVALGLRFPPRILGMVRHRIDPSHVHEVILGAGLHGPSDALRLGFADALSDDPVVDGHAWLQTVGGYPRDAYAAAKHGLNRGADEVGAEDDARFREEVLPVWVGDTIKATIAGFLGYRSMMLALLACQETVEGEFGALTYNIAGLPEAISSSEPEEYIPQMGTKMNAYDLVLVQEDFAYHDLFAPDVTLPHRSEPKPNPPVGQTDAFLADGLNRFSVFAFDPVARTRWPACFGLLDNASDCLAEKGFSTAVTTLADDVELLVVNLHAEAGGGPHDVAARAQGFALLAQVIADAPGPILVGGDTNLKPTQRDGDAVIHREFLQVSGLTEVEQQDPDRDHIDRFFYRSSEALVLEPYDWAVATEFVDDEGNDLSDHPAIRTRFRWIYER